MGEGFIQTQSLYRLLDLEPFLILAALVAFSGIFYKFFLKELSPERHRNVQGHLKNILKHFLFFGVLFLSFIALREAPTLPILRTLPYLALLSFTWGAVIFVKTCRLLVLLYLFMGSMRAGVPLLLVNIFSLVLSVGIAFWTASRIFGLHLGPLLATSAAFSIILGLALQDTLGNLFAGISLQLDKSFEIDDWIEVQSGTQKSIGQVKEISWRSTVLLGLSDELITLPNRFVAQAQVSNFSPPTHPVLRSQIFRLTLEGDVPRSKSVLEESIREIPGVRKLPAPFSFVSETTDSWISLKVIYWIDNFGEQFVVGDRVLSKGLAALENSGLKLASSRLEVNIDHTAPRHQLPGA